ncbi:MAG TPA: sigma-70 family RNA polymerase sigma factor [Polyangiaceae bacterium]
MTTLLATLPMAPPSTLEARAPAGVSARVQAARDGDVAAFEALYREHVGRVHALCVRMTGDPREAESLAQEAFVRAWERLDRFRGESSFATWLHHVTVNVVVSSRRAAIRRLRRVESVEDLERLDPPSTPRRAPEAAMDLERAIAGLPAGARMVFVLFDVEGFSHAEIARELGIAENTSKAQLHRARALLREVLHDGA